MTTTNILQQTASIRELTNEEMATVQGGSFDLGSIVASIAKAVVPMAIDAVVPK